MSLTVREVLLAAAETCERGWCQGAKYEWGSNNRVVKHCLWGGISDAAFPVAGLSRRAYDAMAAHLGMCPIDWQDKPERTQAEVVAALRAAAEAQEKP